MEKNKKSFILSGTKLFLEIVTIGVSIWMVVLVAAFAAGMIAPNSGAVNIFEIGQLYSLSIPGFSSDFPIRVSDPSIQSTSIEPCGVVFYKTGNRWFLLQFWLFYLACWTIVLLIIIKLQRFLESLREGSPFIIANVERMKFIGWGVIVFTLLRIIMLAGALLYMYLNVHVKDGNLIIPFDELMESLHLEIAFVGVIILIISRIFDEGVKMKKEQELTV